MVIRNNEEDEMSLINDYTHLTLTDQIRSTVYRIDPGYAPMMQ